MKPTNKLICHCLSRVEKKLKCRKENVHKLLFVLGSCHIRSSHQCSTPFQVASLFPVSSQYVKRLKVPSETVMEIELVKGNKGEWAVFIQIKPKAFSPALKLWPYSRGASKKGSHKCVVFFLFVSNKLYPRAAVTNLLQSDFVKRGNLALTKNILFQIGRDEVYSPYSSSVFACFM